MIEPFGYALALILALTVGFLAVVVLFRYAVTKSTQAKVRALVKEECESNEKAL
jgi:hypothetical protein